MKNKKAISLILTGIMASALFVGCGNNSADTNGQGSAKTVADLTKLKGQIEMWSTFTDAENKVLKEKIVPAFNKTYPDIKVKITPMPSGDDYKKQILQGAMSGTCQILQELISWMWLNMQSKIT